jgi:hypothetical protein
MMNMKGLQHRWGNIVERIYCENEHDCTMRELMTFDQNKIDFRTNITVKNVDISYAEIVHVLS